MKPQEVSYQTFFDVELFEGTVDSHAYPWHYHECYTLILVEKGSMCYSFGSGQTKLRAGEILIINPKTSHSNTIEEPCSYKALFLPKFYLCTASATEVCPYFDTLARKDDALFMLLLQAIEAIKQASTSHQKDSTISRLTQALLPMAKQEVREHENDAKISKALAFIQRHLDHKLAIADLALLCGLSKFHFQRVFKSTTRLTVHQYIQQQRTLRAKALLEQGNAISHTGFETGFFDQSHFHKAFKKMWAINPTNIS